MFSCLLPLFVVLVLATGTADQTGDRRTDGTFSDILTAMARLARVVAVDVSHHVVIKKLLGATSPD